MSQPSLANEERLSEVIAEYLQSQDRGEPLKRTALLERHPDLAAELAAFFAEQDRVDRLVEPLRDEPATIARSHYTEKRNRPRLRLGTC